MGRSSLIDSNGSRLWVGFQALRELGLVQVSLYTLYQLGLRSGYYRMATSGRRPERTSDFHQFLTLPERDDLSAILGKQGRESLLLEAEEIVNGRVRLFGGASVPLELAPESPPAAGVEKHWTAYQLPGMGDEAQGYGQQGAVDVKILWEPARFGWAFTLGRAYRLTSDERYPAVFWSHAERFLEANPPYQGLHWTSAQEAALRLIAFTFALHVFHGSVHLDRERETRLAQAIADHASRIPPTLVYARAQNNNHLLTEAAGLYTAGLALPDHPSAKKWRNLGWKWFNLGLQSQIADDGAYVQHSANYHRLALQLALWVDCLVESQGEQFPERTKAKLAAATTWLLALLDSQSGRVPNLGPNDGSYILPLVSCPFSDYRPVLQAAASAFLGKTPFGEGLWDEMRLWFLRNESPHRFSKPVSSEVGNTLRKTPHVLKFNGQDSWGYFRATRFKARPGHADQLHFDLWWRGLNLAQDAGTYFYNASPPWNNSLTSCHSHNTVSVNGCDQMRRAGRFLYLDWAQAEVDCEASLYQEDTRSWRRLEAQHDGYRKLGVIHRRSVEAEADGNWVILDSLLTARSPRLGRSEKREHDHSPSENQSTSICSATVHWLLPDWPFEVEDGLPTTGASVRVLSPHGWIGLAFSLNDQSVLAGESLRLQIVRAGELVVGSGEIPPILGWISPTYGVKIPALSVRVTVDGSLPFSISSKWVLPKSV